MTQLTWRLRANRGSTGLHLQSEVDWWPLVLTGGFSGFAYIGFSAPPGLWSLSRHGDPAELAYPDRFRLQRGSKCSDVHGLRGADGSQAGLWDICCVCSLIGFMRII